LLDLWLLQHPLRAGDGLCPPCPETGEQLVDVGAGADARDRVGSDVGRAGRRDGRLSDTHLRLGPNRPRLGRDDEPHLCLDAGPASCSAASASSASSAGGSGRMTRTPSIGIMGGATRPIRGWKVLPFRIRKLDAGRSSSAPASPGTPASPGPAASPAPSLEAP